jgi:hypothetical protein
MPWFIVQSARKTLTIYLVEADTKEDAAKSYDNEKGYLGYFDDESLGLSVVGPFETDEAALADDSSYTQGR